jgi:hypothetical protein
MVPEPQPNRCVTTCATVIGSPCTVGPALNAVVLYSMDNDDDAALHVGLRPCILFSSQYRFRSSQGNC